MKFAPSTFGLKILKGLCLKEDFRLLQFQQLFNSVVYFILSLTPAKMCIWCVLIKLMNSIGKMSNLQQ